MNTTVVIARNEAVKQSSLWPGHLNWIASATPRNDGGVVIASPKGVAIQSKQLRLNKTGLTCCAHDEGLIVIARPKAVAIQFKQAQPNKTGLPRCARNDGGGCRG